jgi:hypothetical protein
MLNGLQVERGSRGHVGNCAFRDRRVRSSVWAVILYGLASYRVMEVVEFFPTREGADDALRRALEDAPELEGEIGVEPVDFNVADAPIEGPAYPLHRRLRR